MRWRPLGLVLVGAAAVAGGCGEGGGSQLGPTLEPEAVTGVYDITRLTFDPDGSVAGADIAARLDAAEPPRLFVALDLTFQLAYVDPATNKFVDVDGTYETLIDGIRLSFPSREAAQAILLPQQIDLTFDEASGTLSFDGGVDADLSRLVELVPEYAEEQFPDPVRGALEVEFTRRADE